MVLLGVAGCASADATPNRASVPSGAPTLVTEPAPQPTAPFLSMIGGARHRVELTIYELQDPRVEQALAAAAARGVAVRVLLNGGYYGEHEDVNAAAYHAARKAANAAAYRYLRGHGVPVRFASSRFAFTHQKTLIADGVRAAIMTLNFTPFYYAADRDYAVIDTRRADVAAIEAVFAADWRDRPIAPSRGAGGLIFSPGATSGLLAVVRGARHSLAVESEELADRPMIAGICAAARRGVSVRLVMTYASEWLSAFRRLAGCGVAVRVLHGERPVYIHAKLIAVDGREVFVGSQNLTVTSLERNRELGILTSSGSVVRGVQRTFERDFAAAAPP